LPLSLTYNTTTVVLRSPELDDILRFSSQAITRQLKGGLPKIFKDPLWPVIEIRQYSFRHLSKTQITDFENLYRASIGLSILLQESYGVTLTGFIMNPTIEILTIKDLCSYDLEFEFLATVVSYLTGECVEDPNYTAVTPEPGDPEFHGTLENDFYYQFWNELGSERMQSEAGAYVFRESY